MGPVAARTRARDVTEGVLGLELGELLGGKRLARLRRVDVEADGALVNRLEDDVAVRIKNLEEAPFVDDLARGVDLDNHVADRAHARVVGAPEVGRSDAQEVAAVFSGHHRVAEVGVVGGQAAVEDLAAEQIVLRIVLAVAPGERAVGVLMEAHHDARVVERLGIIDAVGLHVPADLALRVENRVSRRIVPLQGAAHGIVPDRATRAHIGCAEIVDEVEAI